MTHKSDYLIELIFSKLKRYKAKEINLDKESLERFIFSLFKEK
tara:strand:+ start:253 stop:381 length:129 start_codon:yes stop_codon:yes gene_type:complete